ncbi:MAG: hypothetical protein ACLT16_16470 [[Clostridium] innocuum]
MDYILVSEEIIAYFKEHSTKILTTAWTLTDHIANIERIRMGIDFDMAMLHVKSLYREDLHCNA